MKNKNAIYIDNKILYDDGTGYKYYTCQHCGSHRVSRIQLDGFQPPKLECGECKNEVINSYKFIEDKERIKLGLKKEKTLHKTVIMIEVISEYVIYSTDLEYINYKIREGDCSGVVSIESVVDIRGEEAAKAVIEQGSDPEFFQMDDEGNEIDE